MKISVITPSQIDGTLRERWHTIRSEAGRGPLAGPFFTPEYTTLIGAERPGTRIAVIELEGRVVGFFPFEVDWLGFGGPVGDRMSDYHGVILEAGVTLPVRTLLRACGLRTWRFDHLIDSTGAFSQYETGRAESWLMRLDGGYEAYRASIEARSGLLKRKATDMRRMIRDLGPLRFEFQSTDSTLFERLQEWKSRQYVESGLVDLFRLEWARRTLDRLRQFESAEMSGVMSALYAGERLVAVHLGWRTSTVLHYYLPTYDRAASAYSPGFALLLKMTEHAAGMGIDTIDLGKGNESYKLVLANDSYQVAVGCVEPRLVRSIRSGARAAAAQLKSSDALLNAARWGKRRLRGLAGHRI